MALSSKYSTAGNAQSKSVVTSFYRSVPYLRDSLTWYHVNITSVSDLHFEKTFRNSTRGYNQTWVMHGVAGPSIIHINNEHYGESTLVKVCHSARSVLLSGIFSLKGVSHEI